MTVRNDPAFAHAGGGHIEPQKGLSVREYFAAKAMAAIANGVHGDTDSRQQMLGFSKSEGDNDVCVTVAKMAVEYADALIQALNGKQP